MNDYFSTLRPFYSLKKGTSLLIKNNNFSNTYLLKIEYEY